MAPNLEPYQVSLQSFLRFCVIHLIFSFEFPFCEWSNLSGRNSVKMARNFDLNSRAIIPSCSQLLVLILIWAGVSYGGYMNDPALTGYKPIAMDESVRVVRKPTRAPRPMLPPEVVITSKPIIVLDRLSHPDHAEDDPTEDIKGVVSREYAEKDLAISNKFLSGSNPLDTDTLSDVETDLYKDPRETLFKFPRRMSTRVTEAITSGYRPTFALNEVATPIKNGTKDPNIIAQYSVLLPVLIPGRRRKSGGPLTNIKYVKETRTTMIPVERMVPSYKEYFKAEPVHQQIETNYVRVPDESYIPERSDDRVLPGEEVIKTTIKDY